MKRRALTSSQTSCKGPPKYQDLLVINGGWTTRGPFPALVLFGIDLTIAYISNVLRMQFVIRTGNMEIRPWVKRFLTTRLKIKKNKKPVPWWWLLITRGYHYKKGIIDTILVFWIPWIGCLLEVVVQVRLRLLAVPLFFSPSSETCETQNDHTRD